MDVGSLRYFLVAAERLHFGQAAEELGVAQPALSQRIKTLEARVGVRLFDRSRRAVRLTDAGHVFLNEARRLVDMADRAVRLARAAEKGNAGELHIGYGGSVIFVPKVCALLKNFQQSFPDVSVLMHECKVEEQLQGITTGHLDAALLWGPIGPGYPSLRELVFARAAMSVVLQRDHPLAARNEVSLQDMEGENLVALMDPPGRGITHVVDTLLAATDFSPKIILKVSSLMSVLGLAGAGVGSGIVPQLPIDIISPAFVQRPLAGTGQCNEILVVTSRREASALVQNFVEAAELLSASAL
ncbi:LysR family transcriptional regulator [Paraburkholderia tropica]|uniref:LysR family transcriptional regulator n=1 Tax=Paraburkholderia tropica TaxID=92647 RepID=UPI002AB6991A|nr:LysR substrate-binding domain-containing protein [Paraburkholderia tropica]